MLPSSSRSGPVLMAPPVPPSEVGFPPAPPAPPALPPPAPPALLPPAPPAPPPPSLFGFEPTEPQPARAAMSMIVLARRRMEVRNRRPTIRIAQHRCQMRGAGLT